MTVVCSCFTLLIGSDIAPHGVDWHLLAATAAPAFPLFPSPLMSASPPIPFPIVLQNSILYALPVETVILTLDQRENRESDKVQDGVWSLFPSLRTLGSL